LAVVLLGLNAIVLWAFFLYGSVEKQEAIMACKRCTSDNQRIFNGEVAIHFPGLKGLDEPIVWSFPKLAVCLECGFTEFTVPERELSVLATGKAVGGAVVLDKKVPRSLAA
jgi:hypothetical protein